MRMKKTEAETIRAVDAIKEAFREVMRYEFQQVKQELAGLTTTIRTYSLGLNGIGSSVGVIERDVRMLLASQAVKEKRNTRTNKTKMAKRRRKK